MPKKDDSAPREFHIGDTVKVRLSRGHIVVAAIRAVIGTSEGLHLQVDYGNDETALVDEQQVVHD
jgi:hypothetical protein